MRPRFKKWALPYLEEYKDLALKTLKDINYDFTAIEIGAGKGDFICGMAKKHPETKFLAVEKVVSVAGVLLQKINENELIKHFSGITLAKQDETTAIKFSLNEIDLDDVLIYLINTYHVKDFKIEDISIEDITKKFYKIIANKVEEQQKIIFFRENELFYKKH